MRVSVFILRSGLILGKFITNYTVSFRFYESKVLRLQYIVIVIVAVQWEDEVLVDQKKWREYYLGIEST